MPQTSSRVPSSAPSSLPSARSEAPSGRAASTPPTPREAFRVDWLNLVALVVAHLVAIVGLWSYWVLHGVSLAAVLIGVGGAVTTTFAISIGYHRLFSHRTYETGSVLRFLLLVSGAAAFQNTALQWAADHRRHHRHIDTPNDPYNARRGFWYSHVGWVVQRTARATTTWPVPDLEASRLLRWQHRHYVAIGAVSGFGVPALLGWLAGDLWGGLLFGGALRLVACYHSTFCINSLAHLVGQQPYCLRNTSRDSWPAALITMGEGYHNFHHTFPSDYRNGVRSHQFDPSKWALYLLERAGIVWNLRRTPDPAIARARLRVDLERLADGHVPAGYRGALERTRHTLEATLAKWGAANRSARSSSVGRAVRHGWEAECRLLKRTFGTHYRQWQTLLDGVELAAVEEAPG